MFDVFKFFGTKVEGFFSFGKPHSNSPECQTKINYLNCSDLIGPHSLLLDVILESNKLKSQTSGFSHPNLRAPSVIKPLIKSDTRVA